MLHAQQMILFARVVDAGSFAAAAKVLGQTRAAVSKQIGALEERIGAQLLHRTTRSMHLTEIGAEFYARCARIAQGPRRPSAWWRVCRAPRAVCCGSPRR